MCLFLTRSYLETRKRVIGNSADPDQMPHNAASDQLLHTDTWSQLVSTNLNHKTCINTLLDRF